MKFILIPYIALGLVLSVAIGIKYDCVSPEMLPTYFGSPFVFKEKSLGSSMEYFYSFSGLIGNVTVWSIFLFIINKMIYKLIEKLKNKKIGLFVYKGFIGILLIFTTLNIFGNSVMIGRGFRKGFNYWYMDIDKEAKENGVVYYGELIIFQL